MYIYTARSPQNFPDYDITLSAMPYDHYCGHSGVESQPPPEPALPVLLVEVCSPVQPSTSQGCLLIDAVSTTLNAEDIFQ